jgi:glycogen operon protein
VIYEAHVRGLTARHPGVEPALRGTYLGLAAPPVVAHLKSLGVTALELLPVQHFLSEPALSARGLVNAWGYNPIAFAAPHAAYATATAASRSSSSSRWSRRCTRRHRGHLDVVFNHTAEGNQLGPHLSLKGLDNPTYYRLQPGEAGSYVDYTGCGNSLNTPHPARLRLVTDCLRTWVESYHVDGFRFDLAPVLGRGWNGEHLDGFWNTLLQDPLLSRVKLIVEPWDLGYAGDRTAASRRRSPSGTAASATRCAASGAATPGRSRRSPTGSRAAATSTRAARRRASTS